MFKLLETYRKYEPSDKCYLDDKYIDVIFPGIQTLLLTIDDHHTTLKMIKAKRRSAFNFAHLRIKIDDDYHCNLIVFEDDAVYRFEPLSSRYLPTALNVLINDALTAYFGDAEVFVYDQHPQLECSNKGMCVAYVIKAAILEAAGRPIEFGIDAEEDIKRFATAVEEQFDL